MICFSCLDSAPEICTNRCVEYAKSSRSGHVLIDSLVASELNENYERQLHTVDMKKPSASNL